MEQNKTHALLVTGDLFWLGNVKWVNNCDQNNNVGKMEIETVKTSNKTTKQVKIVKHYTIAFNKTSIHSVKMKAAT